MSDEIRCQRCNKLLAKMIDGRLEIMKGDKGFRIYSALVVAIDCPICGQVTDIVAQAGIKEE